MACHHLGTNLRTCGVCFPVGAEVMLQKNSIEVDIGGAAAGQGHRERWTSF